jgi:hypothetical protein
LPKGWEPPKVKCFEADPILEPRIPGSIPSPSNYLSSFVPNACSALSKLVDAPVGLFLIHYVIIMVLHGEKLSYTCQKYH